MTARHWLAPALLLTSSLLATTRTAALDPILLGPELGLPGTAQAVAYDGSGAFLAVWTCGSAICGARVEAASGLVEAHELVTTVGTPSGVRLASDGSQFLLVWAETRDRHDIYAARITPGGSCLDPGGFVVSRDLVPFDGLFPRAARYLPDVGFDGTTFVVYWIERLYYAQTGVVYTARVTGAGELLDPAGTVVWPASGLWLEPFRLVVERTVMAVVASGGRAMTSAVQSMGWGLYEFGVFFHSPAVSVADASALVAFAVDDPAWLFNSGWGGGVFGHLLEGPSGSLIRFSTAGTAPLAAWEGTDHLVTWSEGGATLGVRLSVSGGFAETRQSCLYAWACFSVPVPELTVPGTATALASNGRGVSLLTTEGDAAYLLTSSFAPAIADGLAAADAAVVAVPDDGFKNVNMRVALRKKLASIGNLVKGSDYAEAVVELDNLLAKVDGCALRFAPDADDWITTCSHQRKPYAVAMRLKDVILGQKNEGPI
ncbi:MAG: hypothetical protein WCC48_01125 [Anaeromyxobacteraceae bacterium]